MTVTEFWSREQVAGQFTSKRASENSLKERRRMYPMLEDLMPTFLPGKVVLDFGCGPGHDTIQMLQSGATVSYCDISTQALDTTRTRLELHRLGGGHEWQVEDSPDVVLPYVNHIHCAGVLHHCSYPLAILKEFREVLREGGECRLMVYDGDTSPHTQSDVPVTEWWTQDEVAGMCGSAGFSTVEYVGGYECSAPWRPGCYAACYRLQ